MLAAFINTYHLCNCTPSIIFIPPYNRWKRRSESARFRFFFICTFFRFMDSEV